MNSFLDLLNNIFNKQQAKAVKPTPTPSPTPSPNIGRGWDVIETSKYQQQKPYRSPIWDKRKVEAPQSFAELISGTKIASEQTGVPQDLLMDIPAIETTGGKFMEQLSGGPGRGWYQFEEAQGFDPMSATESAIRAAQEIKAGRLSRWGTPEGNWGSLNNPSNANGKLTDWYTNEELNQYLAPNRRLQ